MLPLSLRRPLLLASAVFLAATAGYTIGKSRFEPDLTVLTSAGCGLPQQTQTTALPLGAIFAADLDLPLTLGPMPAPDGNGMIRVTFDPKADGRGTSVNLDADGLALPVTYGGAADIPDRITLTCRDGELRQARYTGNRAKTFQIVRAEPENLAEVPEIPATVDAAADEG